jgi:TP901 family phage tail tape measure protein
MANMKVRLLLDLVNRLSGPARAAQRDLRGVKGAADTLKTARGAETLARDLKRTGGEARSTAAALAKARAEAQALGRTNAQPRGLAETRRALEQMRNYRARDARGRFVGAGAAGGGAAAGGMSAGQGAAAGAATGAAAARIGLGPAAAAVAGVAGALAAEKSARSLEKVMFDVGRATDAEGDAIAAYEKLILDLARATGKTKEELGQLLAAAGFAGRPVQELARFTAFAAKATTAWGTASEETGQALAEIGNIYNVGQSGIERIADAVNTIADKSAARESDLVNILRRAGPSGRQIGVTAEQVLALGGALKEVGTGPEVAATALNALFTNVSLGAEATPEFATGLKAIGLEAKKLQKAVRKDAMGAIVDMLERVAKVPDGLKRMEILKQLFGREYADNIGALLNNLPGLMRLLGEVKSSQGYQGSVERDFAKKLETNFNQIERAQQSLDVLMTRLGNGLTRTLGRVAEAINQAGDKVEDETRSGPIERGAAAERGNARAKDQFESRPEPRETPDASASDALRDEFDRKIVGRIGLGEAGKRQQDIRSAEVVAYLLERERRYESMENATLQRLAEAMRWRQAIENQPLTRTGQTERGRAARAAAVDRARQDELNANEDVRRIAQLRAGRNNDDRERLLQAAEELRIVRGQLAALKMGAPLAPKDTGTSLGDIMPAGGAGSGRLGFGLGGAKTLKDQLSVDLRPAGALITQQLADGMRGAQGQTDGAADQIGQAVKARLAAVDGYAAGQQAASTFAAGIRSGMEQAVQAAESGAARVKAALQGAGAATRQASLRATQSGGLHDGVA